MSTLNSVVRTKDWIITRIFDGTFKNDALPSAYEISRSVDVSQDDVEQALHELVTEQLITEVFQEGYFVKKEPVFLYPINELKSITRMIEERGFTAGTILISSDPEIPSLDDKRALSIEDDKQITVIERIRTADGMPVVYCLDKIKKEDLRIQPSSENQSLFETLFDDPDFQVKYATCELEAMSYEPYISGALDCSPEDSLLILKQVHYNYSDEPVLFSLLYFKSSQIRFQIQREVK